MVECQLPKLNVAGSSPVTRLNNFKHSSSTRLDELKNLRSGRHSTSFVTQGLQDQRTRFIEPTILCTLASACEQGLSSRFVIVTLLSSRLKLFCCRKCQGQLQIPLLTKE